MFTLQAKELFLAYHGVETVLPFMRPSNKALCAHAVDIYLQLSVESSKNNGCSYIDTFLSMWLPWYYATLRSSAKCGISTGVSM